MNVTIEEFAESLRKILSLRRRPSVRKVSCQSSHRLRSDRGRVLLGCSPRLILLRASL
jgi:hypothetical protein